MNVLLTFPSFTGIKVALQYKSTEDFICFVNRIKNMYMCIPCSLTCVVSAIPRRKPIMATPRVTMDFRLRIQSLPISSTTAVTNVSSRQNWGSNKNHQSLLHNISSTHHHYTQGVMTLLGEHSIPNELYTFCNAYPLEIMYIHQQILWCSQEC